MLNILQLSWQTIPQTWRSSIKRPGTKRRKHFLLGQLSKRLNVLHVILVSMSTLQGCPLNAGSFHNKCDKTKIWVFSQCPLNSGCPLIMGLPNPLTPGAFSTWWKSSHEHWAIPEQRSPHLLYMYKTRAILALWLYSDARNIPRINANFAQKQFSMQTATCGRDNKNVTVSLNMWKLKHLLSRTVMSLVTSRLQISGLWRKFTIWRKLLFLEVLFRKFSYQRWKYSLQTGRRDT